MPEKREVAEIREVARYFERMISERRSLCAGIIRDTAVTMQPRIDELRKRILERLKPHTRTGAPCSLLRIIAEDHLESRFNRILKWCATETGTHGFGREFLNRLANLVELPEMIEDLKNGSTVDVNGEEKVDSSGNMPDLIVRTVRAALLFENKVNAPESGGSQYKAYEDWFPGFASPRSRSSIKFALSARGQREKPNENWVFISHRNLSQLFHDISSSLVVPIWGRIVAAQCAAAFDEANIDEKSGARLIAAATQAEKGTPTLENWRTLLDAKNIGAPLTPWSNKI